MARTGQNPIKSATAAAKELSINTLQDTRTGNRFRVPENHSGKAKYFAASDGVRNAVANGKFKGNVREAQSAATNKNVQRFMEIKAAIDQG